MDLDFHGFTDCGNMGPYAGLICILWPTLGGAMPPLESDKIHFFKHSLRLVDMMTSLKLSIT